MIITSFNVAQRETVITFNPQARWSSFQSFKTGMDTDIFIGKIEIHYSKRVNVRPKLWLKLFITCAVGITAGATAHELAEVLFLERGVH